MALSDGSLLMLAAFDLNFSVSPVVFSGAGKGATVAVKLVSDTMSEIKRENHKDELKTMQAKMDRSEEDLKKSKSQPEISSQNRDLSSHDGDGISDRSKKNSEDQLKIISKI